MPNRNRHGGTGLVKLAWGDQRSNLELKYAKGHRVKPGRRHATLGAPPAPHPDAGLRPKTSDPPKMRVLYTVEMINWVRGSPECLGMMCLKIHNLLCSSHPCTGEVEDLLRKYTFQMDRAYILTLSEKQAVVVWCCHQSHATVHVGRVESN